MWKTVSPAHCSACRPAQHISENQNIALDELAEASSPEGCDRSGSAGISDAAQRRCSGTRRRKPRWQRPRSKASGVATTTAKMPCSPEEDLRSGMMALARCSAPLKDQRDGGRLKTPPKYADEHRSVTRSRRGDRVRHMRRAAAVADRDRARGEVAPVVDQPLTEPPAVARRVTKTEYGRPQKM